MDVPGFVGTWKDEHDIGDEWAMMDVARCVQAAIAQDREERGAPKNRIPIDAVHCEECGCDIEVNPPYEWEDWVKKHTTDPLAAKLERLAEGADDNGCYVVMRMYRKKSTVNIHGKGPLSELMTGHGPDYHWAAVDAALEEVEGE